jgi:SAM-dependent methyltransferase
VSSNRASRQTVYRELLGGPVSCWGVNTQPERLSAVLDTVPVGASILDLGTGRGAYVDVLSRAGYRVTGCDMHLYAEWRSSRPSPFICGNASCLPFPDRTFDATIAFEILEHCPEPGAVLAETVRCTRNHVVLSVPDCAIDPVLMRHGLALSHWTDPTHCSFFTQSRLVDLLTQSGLRVETVARCYEVRLNDYFWTTARLPGLLARIGRKLFEVLDLAKTHYGSILVVSRVIGGSAQ